MAKDSYTATLETSGETYTAEGVTAFDAISSLPVDYTKIKNKGTVSLMKQGKTASRFMYYRPLRKVIANKLMRVGLANNLDKLLKGEDTYVTDKVYKPVKTTEDE